MKKNFKSACIITPFSVIVLYYGLASVSIAQDTRDEKIASLEAKINEMQEKYEGQISKILEQYQETQQQLEKALVMIEELKKESEEQAVQVPAPSQSLSKERTVAKESHTASEPPQIEDMDTASEDQGLQAFSFQSQAEEEGGAYDFSELLLEEIKLGPVEWHGRLESRYIQTRSERNIDKNELSTFQQSTFALWAGMEITKDIEVIAELEFEPAKGERKVQLDQARLTWDLIKLPPSPKLIPQYERTWGLIEKGILSFTFGKFYYPFGIERFSYSGPVNKLVDRPSPFRQIIPGTYSDVGAKLHGLIPIYKPLSLRYEAALTNGLAGPLRPPDREDRQSTDSNRNKQVGGRLGLSLRDWFEIGGSFITGKYDSDSDEDLSYIGADVRVTYNKIKLLSSTAEEIIDLRGEYVFNHFNHSSNVGPDFSRDGWYVQAAYKFDFHRCFLHYIEPVFRYDSLHDDIAKFATAFPEGGYDPDTALELFEPVLRVDRYAFGIGWSPFKHFKIKGEYEISDEKGSTQEFNNNAFLYEMTIDW